MKLFNKIKQYSNKIILGFGTLAILITGNFTLNYTVVNADTGILIIDGIQYVVDSFQKDGTGTITKIVKDGIEFLAKGWATSNLESNNLWSKSVASGLITITALESMKDSYQLWSATGDLIGNAYDSSKQWVLDGWNKAIDNTKNASLDLPGEWLIKRLLGAGVGLADTYTSIKDAVLDLNNSYTESAYRNYYSDYSDVVGTSDRVYNTGNTTYYAPYVDDSKTFYNTFNNTYEIVNNYNYDIYNHYYNYYTNNNYYQMSNTYNNTYVFNVTGDYDYSIYYKLPNGSNSFNLTEDEIKGIRTDFNVSNYEINYLDNSDILSLYHFNGSLDTLTTDSFLDGGLVFNGVNFVNSFSGFDLALLHTINNNPFFSLTSSTGTSQTCYGANGSISCSGTGTQYILARNFNNYTNYTLTSSFSTLGNLFSFSYIDSIKNLSFMFYYDSTGPLYFTSDSSFSQSISSTVRNSMPLTDVLSSRSLSIDSIPNGISIFKGWNFFEFNFNGTDFDVYNNGTLFTTIPSLDNFYLVYNLACNYPYFLIDELFISDTPSDTHDIKYLPYDNNYYFTLPNTDTNNKILIQSIIPVNDFQFGGIRSINATTGDVYFYLSNNVISSIQQFNGTDWISVDGALYNETIGKWVSAIGFSIDTGNWDFTDITANDVKDDNTMARWLSGVLNNIHNTILLGFNSIVATLDGLFGHEEDGTISSDDDTAEDIITDSGEAVNPNEDLKDYMLELKDLAKDNVFDDYDDLLGDELENISDLSTETMGIFDIFTDNGLTIILIGGLILSIVRLVI